MTDTQPSGIDLARAALATARAAAKTRPAQPQKKTRTTRGSSSRQRLGDPMGLGAAIDRMMTERGWEPPEEGGSILDQWPTIAPELVGKVAAVRFEHDTGTLHLRPVSPAYGTQLRLHQTQVLTRVQQAPGGPSVRALRILPVGAALAAAAVEPTETTGRAAADPEPVRTRETASAGYRYALALNLENKLNLPMADPYEEEARQRQIAAARANRLPETENREAMWAQDAAETVAGPRPGSMEASERAALARKRLEQAGVAAPRQVFDVA